MIEDNSKVQEALFRRFKYLLDFPFQISVKFKEDAECLGIIETDDFLALLVGYAKTQVSLEPNHFAFLSESENSRISHYRLMNLVEPWPQPFVGVQYGKTTGTYSTDVQLLDIGVAQIYWGDDIGFLWEAVADPKLQDRLDYEPIINQFWRYCESELISKQISRIVTTARDPGYPEQWYTNFLKRMGYLPIKGKEFAVFKEI